MQTAPAFQVAPARASAEAEVITSGLPDASTPQVKVEANEGAAGLRSC